MPLASPSAAAFAAALPAPGSARLFPAALCALFPILTLLVAAPAPLPAQGQGGGAGGGIQPMAGGEQPYAVQVTPKFYTATWDKHTQDHVGQFTVKNTGTSTAEFDVACSRSGQVLNCSPDVLSFLLLPGKSRSIYVTYDVGTAGSGTLTLTAVNLMGQDVDDDGTMTITVEGDPPSVVVDVPAGIGIAIVRNRQPLVRAFFQTDEATTLDTAETVLTWRGDTVTALARHNRGLLEWEVDRFASATILPVAPPCRARLYSPTTRRRCWASPGRRWAQ